MFPGIDRGLTMQSAPLPLLCALGRHKAEPLPQWNNGYYFSRCKRCGLDLVRTAFEGWHLPQGSKVVWRAEAPRHARGGEPARDAQIRNAAVRDDVPERAADELSAVTPHASTPVGAPRAIDEVGANDGVAPVEDFGTDRDERANAPEPDRSVEFPIRDRAVAQGGDRLPQRPDARIDDDVRTAERATDARSADRVARKASEPADPGPGPHWMFPDEVGDADKAGAADGGNVADAIERSPVLSTPTERPADAELPIQQVLRSLSEREEGPVRVIEDAEPDDLPDIPALVRPMGLRSDGPPIDPEAAPRQLQPEEQPQPAETPPQRRAKAEPVTVPYVIPDFMEETSEELWDYEPAAPPASSPPPAPPAGPHWTETLRRRSGDLGSSGRDMLARTLATAKGARSVQVSDDVPPASGGAFAAPALRDPWSSNPFIRQVAVSAVVLVGGLVLVASVVDGRRNEAAPAAPAGATRTPAPAASDISARVNRSAALASAGRRAGVAVAPWDGYVTASLLNCRSVPSNDGPTVRKLDKGAPVRVLGTDFGWVSIAHRGRQCWASAKYVSVTKPA